MSGCLIWVNGRLLVSVHFLTLCDIYNLKLIRFFEYYSGLMPMFFSDLNQAYRLKLT